MIRLPLKKIHDEVMSEIHILDKIVDDQHSPKDMKLRAEGALRECHFFMDMLGYSVTPERWRKV